MKKIILQRKKFDYVLSWRDFLILEGILLPSPGLLSTSGIPSLAHGGCASVHLWQGVAKGLGNVR